LKDSAVREKKMTMSSYDMKTTYPERVTIIGAARSGIAAARFFTERGVSVLLSDTCSSEQMEAIVARNGLSGIRREAQGHSGAVLDADLIVLSPGVPSDISVLLQARERSIPVWSEMELGFRASRAPFLAVTGSSGKSTTVSLAGAALAAAGIETIVAGNIGLPVIAEVPQVSGKGFVVAEVSSFQLENIDGFRPKAAAVLNLMKNHLDRYASENAYYEAKKAIARNLTKEEYIILNANDPLLRSWGDEVTGETRVVYFGADVDGGDAFWCEGSLLRYRLDGTAGVMGDLVAMKLRGGHNYDNAAVAAALAKIAGAPDEKILQGLCSFTGLRHRLEFITECDGVDWYNDSKSTTAESIDCAVRAFPAGVHLIAGGRDKGCDFSVVNDAISRFVKTVILIGEATERMAREWDGLAPIVCAGTLEEAVEVAQNKATAGHAVVLSPGCSSFDMFDNYEQRGDRFRDIVLSSCGRAVPHE
jgi:UDP-N-acetylmuramoylalanine--D-glutamate ligase